MQGTISFAKTLDSRQPPPPFLEPGRYVVSIEFPDGRSGTHRFVVPPSHKAAVHEEHIVCPQGDQKAYVTFHTPVLEESVADAGVHVVAHVMKRPQRLRKSEWQLNRLDPEWTIHFDPVTGAPTGYDITQWLDTPTSTANISTRNVNLSDLSSNERFLGLPAGEYSVQLSWKRADSVGTFEQSSFPAKGAAMDGKLTIDVETRDVLLEMPEAMQEHVQKLLKLAAARSTEATEAPRAE